MKSRSLEVVILITILITIAAILAGDLIEHHKKLQKRPVVHQQENGTIVIDGQLYILHTFEGK